MWSLDTLTRALAEAGADEAREEAMLLITTFAGASRASLLCDRTRLFDCPSLDRAAEKRLSRYPLQYILGEWTFFGNTFKVNEHCLIPRPDTEILVEEALKRLPPHAVFADLCTGSGCIGVSVLKERPDTVCHALELYPDTLALAVENAGLNGVSDRFNPVCADLLDGGVDAVKRSISPTGDLLDAILSNPPYIKKKDVDRLAPELFFEPRAALDGGNDGLTFYRAILHDYRPLLRDGGLALMEIGFDQAEDLRRLAGDIPGWTDFELIRDLGGRDRVVCLRAAPI